MSKDIKILAYSVHLLARGIERTRGAIKNYDPLKSGRLRRRLAMLEWEYEGELNKLDSLLKSYGDSKIVNLEIERIRRSVNAAISTYKCSSASDDTPPSNSAD